MSELTNDNLKEHLVPYSDEEIQKIREEKMQLVTASEFKALHKEKLALENKLSNVNTYLKEISEHASKEHRDTESFLAAKALAEIKKK